MSDWDGRDLVVLAPDVEVDAALALFERRRRRDRRQRRLAFGAVAAMALVALAWLAATQWIDARKPSVDDLTIEVFEPRRLDLDDLSGWPRLSVAASQGEDVGYLGDERHWVVIIWTSATHCLPPDGPFDWDGSTVELRGWGSMTEAEWEACPTRGVLTFGGHVLFEHRVAVAREGLPRSFSVHLPADETNELAARSVRVDLPEIPPLPAARGDGPTARSLHARAALLDRPLEVVRDQDTLASRFATLGLGMRSTVPDVDFDRHVVFLVTASTGACEPTFTGFDLEDDELIARFVDGPDPLACGTGTRAYTFVIAVERADLPGSFVLRRPADPALGVTAESLLVSR